MRKLKYRVWNKEKKCYYMFDTTIGFAGTEKVWGDIEQYTRLKDIKRTKEFPEGQEMYEGDLIKSEYSDKPMEIIFISNPLFGASFAAKFKKGGHMSIPGDAEIINPEEKTNEPMR